MKISIVGGAGRVGLPLAISLALKDHEIVVIDTDKERVKKINERVMPFYEEDAQQFLNQIKSHKLFASEDSQHIIGSEVCILIIGTPVNDDGSPGANSLLGVVENIAEKLIDTKLLMLRSTVYPGISENISELLRSKGIQTLVSFCPERIAEGIAMREIKALPQIIGAETEEAFKLSEQVFEGVTPSYIRTTFKEAEISKLFANSYRYLKFAVANEFFMLCINSGINWENVWYSLKKDYPRASDLPYPGLAAGPCLVKDTLQLDYFADKGFSLGQASLNINEGLPLYIIEQIKKSFDLENSTVGILGMTFKAGVDDFRSSLSFRLRDELLKVSRRVLCSDPILQKNYFVSINELTENSDIIIVATPHLEYARLEFDQPTVDIWRITSTKSLF